ncbi:MAG: PhzF family phenazine biosynthesis protein [Acidobacteria bacterium]|nr:PhzF family phenazine biosynthesis protein [Acidobacteriota bacterium]
MKTELPIFTVDAFTDAPFKGNPAAVCLLPEARDADWMLAVAAEMNLAETAFLVPRADGYDLRWFTPTVEIPLCGHATLASAHILWQTGKLAADEVARFHTMSGWLTAKRIGELIELDFPALTSYEADVPEEMIAALGVQPVSAKLLKDATGRDRNYLAEFSDARTVRELHPSFMQLRSLPYGVIVTAQSDTSEFDFVSRYFASAYGIDEDPVTGSAHCALTPYWSAKLGKTEMMAYQASARGGQMQVVLQGDRVLMRGAAVTILRGTLLV